MYEKLMITLIIVSFIYITYKNLKEGFRSFLEDQTIAGGDVIFFAVVLIFTYFLFFLRKPYQRVRSINHVLVIYCLYFFISYYFLVDNAASLGTVVLPFVLSLWVFCFGLGSKIGSLNTDKLYMFIYFFSLFLIIPVIAQTFYYYYTNDIISTIKMGNDVLFNTIVFFPFVFLLDRNKLLRAILILLFLIVSFLSYKRSVIISTLIALVVYYIFSSDLKGKLKGVFKWYFLIFVPVIVYLSTSLFQLIGENVVNRFERLSQDGGNGRNEIYSRLLDVFMESDFLQMFFGHGYMSTRKYIGVLAHNDFIQLLFDFGIVGFSLYLLFFASFVKLIFVKYKRRRLYRVEYATFVSLIVFLLIMTQSNCFIYSPFLLSPMLFLLGILNYRLVNVWK